jgi:hypothetical protein
MINNINYDKLMALNPFEYERFVNSKGQEIVFYEHPTRGDEEQVICVCHDLRIAAYSGFYETDDMLADHGEYEPWFDEEGLFNIGDLGPDNS